MSVVRKTKSELTTQKQKENSEEEVKEMLKGLLPEGYSDEAGVEGVYRLL